MVYYIIPFFLPLLYFLRSNYISYFSIFSVLCFMLFLAALRWQTGTDWFPYYNDFITPNIRQDFELGYVVYVNTIRWFTESYSIFLFITTLIPLLLIHSTLYKCVDSKKCFILSLSYFYTYYYLGSFFGAERRIIAIGLCFSAVGFLVKSNKVNAFICILLATLFHSSAAITVLFFFIQKIKLKFLLYFMFLLAICIVPLNIYVGDIISVAVSNIPIDIIRHKLTVYTENSSNYGEVNLFGLIKRFVIYFIMSVCVLRTYLKDNEELIFLLKIYISGVILYTILTPVSAMFSVLTIYFSIVEVILIPMVLTKLRIIDNAPFFIFLFILYLCCQTYSILSSYSDLFYPYISVISGLNRFGIQ